MKALVNGCSFSRGPGSWPYWLRTVDQRQMINLACAGAGNDYIFESTVGEVLRQPYDLVLIMWSGPSRRDLLVEDIDYFADSRYTSKYQSSRNDWPEKIVEPVNDQDLVNKNWIFGCGHQNGEAAMKRSRAFDGIYRYTGYSQSVYHLAVKIVALQSILKQRQVPYVFSFYDDYCNDFKQYADLYQAIDWHNCCTDQNIWHMAQQAKDLDQDHPGLNTHQQWAQLIDNHISTRIKNA